MYFSILENLKQIKVCVISGTAKHVDEQMRQTLLSITIQFMQTK